MNHSVSCPCKVKQNHVKTRSLADFRSFDHSVLRLSLVSRESVQETKVAGKQRITAQTLPGLMRLMLRGIRKNEIRPGGFYKVY